MKNELKNKIMSRVKKIHFIGIGGSGMSGIALILCDLGYEVSGSDLNVSATIDCIFKKHRHSHLNPTTTTYVYFFAVC